VLGNENNERNDGQRVNNEVRRGANRDNQGIGRERITILFQREMRQKEEKGVFMSGKWGCQDLTSVANRGCICCRVVLWYLFFSQIQAETII